MTHHQISPIYDHVYARGWSGGLTEYRYGAEESKVYNPAKRPKFERAYLTQAMVSDVAAILREIGPHESKWAREGDTLAGLRRGLVTDGLTWPQADDTARELIRRAFAGMGVANRPEWPQRQRYATLDHQCLWCAKDLDHEGKFCCSDHARLALQNFDFETNWGASEVGRAAYRVIRRDREDERTCELERCDQTFRPMSSDSGQKYCCKAHAYEAMRVVLPELDCEFCGRPFTPSERSQRFCCQDHATAALRKDNDRICARPGCDCTFKPKHGDDPDRDKYCSRDCMNLVRQVPKHPKICEWDGTPFLGKSKAAKFCCDACSQAHRKAMRGILPARIGPPVFDFLFAQAA